jgi:hypothetical protein
VRSDSKLESSRLSVEPVLWSHVPMVISRNQHSSMFSTSWFCDHILAEAAVLRQGATGDREVIQGLDTLGRRDVARHVYSLASRSFQG